MAEEAHGEAPIVGIKHRGRPDDAGLEALAHHHAKHWFSQGVWQTPRVIVDWDEEEVERSVGWSELFYDLIYVSAIARLGESLRGEDGELLPISTFILLFLSVFNQWQESTMYSTRFNIDDLSHKLLFFALMLGVLGMGMHIKDVPYGRNATAYALCAAYSRIVLLLASLRVMYHVPRARLTLGISCIISTLVPIVWVTAAFAPEHMRPTLFWVAVALDPCRIFVFIFWRLCLGCQGWSNRSSAPMPLHTDHFSERFGLFIVIVLGETVTGVTLEDPANADLGARLRLYVAVALGFAMAACTKLLYFDVDAVDVEQHALRRLSYTGLLWNVSHIVLGCALAMVGSGIDLLCTYELGPVDTEGFDPHITRGRFLVGIAYGVTLLSLVVVRVTHEVPPAVKAVPVLVRVYWAQVGAQVMGACVCIMLPYVTDDTERGVFGLLATCAVLGVLLVALNFLDEVVAGRMAEAAQALPRRKGKVEDGTAPPVVAHEGYEALN